MTDIELYLNAALFSTDAAFEPDSKQGINTNLTVHIDNRGISQHIAYWAYN